jgi:polar amino acid transport system permease protein
VFDWSQVWKYLFSGVMLQGAWVTLWISVVSQALGVILGTLLAIMRISRNPILNLPARFYIWIFRGSPLLVQLLILYEGLPQLRIPLLTFTALEAAILGLSLNEAAYMAEIVRAGILSVDPGQMEAAKSLGMTYSLAMRRIILPQAARVVVPPLGNEFNNMLKSSSLVSFLGVVELTRTAELYGAPTFSVLELLIAATFWYLIMTTIWGYVQNLIERNLDVDRKQSAPFSGGWLQRFTGFGARRAPKVPVPAAGSLTGTH